MRYLFLVSVVAAAAHAAPTPSVPECRIKLAASTVHVGSTLKAELDIVGGGYITGVTIAGRPMRMGTPATWVADKEGTFTVEGTVSGTTVFHGTPGTNHCSTEYTVVAGADPKPQALVELLGWPKADNFFCRVKYYGSADRKAGALFDMSLPLGAGRYSTSTPDSQPLPAAVGVARTGLVLGESDLRFQLTVDYEVLACRDGAIPANEPGPVRTYQSVSIRPLLYRGSTLLAPISPVIVRKTSSKDKFPFVNCWGQNIGGMEESWNGRFELPDEPMYFETTTGNGVLQVKCSQDPAIQMPPLPEPASPQGPIPTR